MLQLQNCEVHTTKQLRKTRKGWLGSKIIQTHLREDIPCGFQLCPEHGHQSQAFPHDERSDGVIYFLDSYTLIHQTDLIYNCPQLRDLIVLQSSIEQLKAYTPITSNRRNNANLSKYNAFKNYVESLEISSTRLLILPDNYHKAIKGSPIEHEVDGIGLPQGKELKHLEKCVRYYRQHCSEFGLKGVQFQILTADSDLLAERNNTWVPIVSLIDFLKQTDSNLLDFMGFEMKEEMFLQRVHPEHIEINEAISLVKRGKLYQGKYMGDRSYIKVGNRTYKIILENNRAMFGDVIIAELYPVSRWKVAAKGMPEEQTLDEGSLLEATESKEMQELVAALDGQKGMLPTGRVVAIYKKLQKNYCGSIKSEAIYKTSEMQDESEVPYEIYEFVPVDDKFPNFYIRSYNAALLKGKRLLVVFDQWPETSQLPLGHYFKTIGDIGDNRTEADVILLEHNVEIKEFSKAAYECLPSDNFNIPKEEYSIRLDLRAIDVVSIDPPGCKDIDDALHCLELPNGNLQIGVHIADVSYYVRPDTALDLEARNRCTTVYLVDRRTDMLPKLLTQNLCSLRADVERLSFSTIWEIDRDSNIISTKYTKSIIKSRRAFTYMEAQDLIDSGDQSNIAKSIRNLNEIAKKLKKRRNEGGALTLASTQVKITLEEETHSATDVQMYQLVETNHLIQEFMLLANIAVAKKIHQRFPAISILRRHVQPKQNELETLRAILKTYGFDFAFSTSKELADSLDRVVRSNDPFFNKLVRIMTTRCMNEATYFCSADFDISEFYHYGLATPFYTHFTSPIRRYADVLVHRLLAAAIDLEPLPNFMINKLKMTKICEKMNMRNRMARYASRASSDYHTYQFFKDRHSTEKAVVCAISEEHLTLMLIKFGLETKIGLSESDRDSLKQLNKEAILSRVRVNGRMLNLFEYVEVELKVELKGFHKVMEVRLV